MSNRADTGRPCPTRRAVGLGVLCLAVAPLGLPLHVGAQQAGKTLRVGCLVSNRPDSPQVAPYYDAFEASLRQHGWKPGVNVHLDYRASEGNPQRLDEHAAELVQAKVDVILVVSYPHIVAARRATSTIPIVMVAVSNPVGFGFIDSLAHPGGNVTGMTFDPGPELNSKPMQHLKEMRPGLSRLMVLRVPSSPGWAQLEPSARESARLLQISIDFVDASTQDEVEAAFAAAKRMHVDALLAWFGPSGQRFHEQVARMALQAALPSASQIVAYADVGGLLAFGPDIPYLYRRAAGYVDKILRGAKPGELPVEQATRFELAINRKTAKALGITIPDAVLLRADRVID